jgi:hypothetical protein
MTDGGRRGTSNIAALPANARLGADRKASVQRPRPLRRSILAKPTNYFHNKIGPFETLLNYAENVR